MIKIICNESWWVSRIATVRERERSEWQEKFLFAGKTFFADFDERILSELLCRSFVVHCGLLKWLFTWSLVGKWGQKFFIFFFSWIWEDRVFVWRGWARANHVNHSTWRPVSPTTFPPWSLNRQPFDLSWPASGPEMKTNYRKMTWKMQTLPLKRECECLI